MPSKEKPVIFNSEMVRAILDSRKTQTRRIIKESFIYSLTGNRIYGIHTGDILLKGCQNEKSGTKIDSNIAKQRLYGWFRWSDIFSYQIQRLWEKGVRGLVSVKRRRCRKRIQEHFDVSQWQENYKINSSFGMHGLSWNAIEKIYAGETFGWQPFKQQAGKLEMGNARRKLDGQKNPRERQQRRKTSDGEAKQFRMRTFEMGTQSWVMQPKASCSCSWNDSRWNISYSEFQINSTLWVRETWRCTGGGNLRNIIYRAEGDSALSFCGIDDGRVGILHVPEPHWAEWDRLVYKTNRGCEWRSPIHMFRWAARIFLEITNIRAERVQDISYEGIDKEGIKTAPIGQHYKQIAKCAFKKLWDSINAKRGYGWDKNNWVWVIEFKQLPERK